MDANIKKRINSKYTVNPESGCWIYTGGLSTGGYGQFSIKHKNFIAHRVSYEANVGKIPKGMLVCHTCDVRHCINPDHLFLGTPKDNAVDMVEKGRKFVLKGSDNHMTNLSEKDVVKIRKMHSMGTKQTNICAIYKVSPCTISNIVNLKSWTHV